MRQKDHGAHSQQWRYHRTEETVQKEAVAQFRKRQWQKNLVYKKGDIVSVERARINS